MPLAIPIVIGLAAAMTLMVALALQQGYRHVFYDLLIDFADRIERVSVGFWRAKGRPLAPFADAIRWSAIKIDEGFSAVIIAFETPFVWLLNQASRVLENVGNELGGLAEDVAAALDRMARVGIRAAVAAATIPLLLPLAALQATVRLMDSIVLPALHRAFTATAERVGRLERAGQAQARRLSRLDRLSIGLAASGVAVWALTRVGLGWIRCRNVSKLGKRACAMDFSILDSLLMATMFLGGPISVERLTRELLGQADLVERALRAGFGELRDLPPL